MTDRPKTVLVVDDSPTMRRMVAWVLIPMGLEVVEAGDGKEALKLLEERTFDLAIVDINMPVMDGIQLMRRIRGKAGLEDLPVLMLTTESSDLMKQAGRAAGATGWLVKPFDPARLLEVIKKVIK